MGYVWLLLGALGVICAVALCMSVLVRYVAKSFPLSSPVFPVGGIVLTAAYLLASVPMWSGRDLTAPFIGFLVLCGLLLVQLKLSGVLKEIGFFVFCLVASLLIPSDFTLFETLGDIWTYPVLAASLYVMTRLFMIMDRVPWFSNLTLMAQGILILFLLKNNILPDSWGYSLFYAFVASIAVAQTIKVYFGQPVLGEFASLISGFALGYLWIFVTAKGFWGLAPVLYSYSAVEVSVSFFLSSIAARRLTDPVMPFFVEQAFDTDLNSKRLIKAIFLVLVLLSLLALVNMGPGMWPTVLIVLGFGLFATCFQFKRWAVPKVRFRDLGSDLKLGLTELKKEMMTIPLKKKVPKKKGRKK